MPMRFIQRTVTKVLIVAVYAAAGLAAPIFAQHPPPQNSGATVSITIGSGVGGGGDGGGGLPREVTTGDAVVNGLAYPGSVVTIRVDGAVAATLATPADGRFTRTFTGLPGGLHTFAVSATDARGKSSPTISLTLSVPGGTTTTIDNLFLPPTLDVASPVILPDSVVLRGYSFPGSTVFMVLSIGKYYEARASLSGAWSISIPSRELGLGSHLVRARAIFGGGLQSEQSAPVVFLILPEALPPGVTLPPSEILPPIEQVTDEGVGGKAGDLNSDGRVNLTDFSILMYFWGQPATFESFGMADLNKDAAVDLRDLSIMLYWWTN